MVLTSHVNHGYDRVENWTFSEQSGSGVFSEQSCLDIYFVHTQSGAVLEQSLSGTFLEKTQCVLLAMNSHVVFHTATGNPKSFCLTYYFDLIEEDT